MGTPPVDMSVETNEQSILHLPDWKMVAFLSVCVLACTYLAFTVGPTEWGVARRIFAGLLGGAWTWYCLFINRILVA